MSTYSFITGQKYAKSDIYRICNVPVSKQKGNWNTGYTKYGRDWFIFCNIGIPGRTGHDYENRFVGSNLVWYGKTQSRIGQASINSLLKPDGDILVFYRESDRDPFTYAGNARASTYKNTIPVEITWAFERPEHEVPEILAEEVANPEQFIEGATRSIFVNIFERNPQARAACIAAYGAACSVCGLNFEKVYGEIGAGFIHVHHLKQLSDIRSEYKLDPIKDLRPVCPNCHAMLHKRNPPYEIAELKLILKKN